MTNFFCQPFKSIILQNGRSGCNCFTLTFEFIFSQSFQPCDSFACAIKPEPDFWLFMRNYIMRVELFCCGFSYVQVFFFLGLSRPKVKSGLFVNLNIFFTKKNLKYYAFGKQKSPSKWKKWTINTSGRDVVIKTWVNELTFFSTHELNPFFLTKFIISICKPACKRSIYRGCTNIFSAI